jgi:hypothetical protein
MIGGVGVTNHVVRGAVFCPRRRMKPKYPGPWDVNN